MPIRRLQDDFLRHCRSNHRPPGAGERIRMSIAELSIKRPVTAIMFFISLFVIGLIAAIRLPLEAFPEVSPPFIFVSLPYAGSTPEEVERTVLRPAEEALATMSGIKRMDSNARSDGAQ